MMNKQIRRMIDEIFADMKMTADNLIIEEMPITVNDMTINLTKRPGRGARMRVSR